VTDLEGALRARLAAGGRCFVPYVTGGLPGVDAELLRAVAAAGADAIEVGIPFSDPVMDGGVVQEASRVALESGATPNAVLATIADAAVDVPIAVMTYVNPVFRRGYEAFIDEARSAGVGGVIVPDQPMDEAEDWIASCADRGVASVFLAAPGSSTERLRSTAASSHGFVYCVATYGVTGAREQLSGTAREVVEALRPLTEIPLLIGVGIATPGQAAEACAFADGVIVGSALMTPMVAGDRDGFLRLLDEFRAAIPASSGAFLVER
jgi:tryptophan synthase alpha chain